MVCSLCKTSVKLERKIFSGSKKFYVPETNKGGQMAGVVYVVRRRHLYHGSSY